MSSQNSIVWLYSRWGPPVFFNNARPEEKHLYERIRALIHPIAIGLHNDYDNDVSISSGRFHSKPKLFIAITLFGSLQQHIGSLMKNVIKKMSMNIVTKM